MERHNNHAGSSQARTRGSATGQQRHGRGQGKSHVAHFPPPRSPGDPAAACSLATAGDASVGVRYSAHQQKAKAHYTKVRCRRMARSERTWYWLQPRLCLTCL